MPLLIHTQETTRLSMPESRMGWINRKAWESPDSGEIAAGVCTGEGPVAEIFCNKGVIRDFVLH